MMWNVSEIILGLDDGTAATVAAQPAATQPAAATPAPAPAPAATPAPAPEPQFSFANPQHIRDFHGK